MTTKLKFPTHLRKMWSGSEVQEWLDKQQAEQEPVAWMDNDGNVCDNNDFGDAFPIPLYTSPVRTKDLTDDEIDEIGKSYFDEWSFGFARAVIAAYREKNK